MAHIQREARDRLGTWLTNKYGSLCLKRKEANAVLAAVDRTPAYLREQWGNQKDKHFSLQNRERRFGEEWLVTHECLRYLAL